MNKLKLLFSNIVIMMMTVVGIVVIDSSISFADSAASRCVERYRAMHESSVRSIENKNNAVKEYKDNKLIFDSSFLTGLLKSAEDLCQNLDHFEFEESRDSSQENLKLCLENFQKWEDGVDQHLLNYVFNGHATIGTEIVNYRTISLQGQRLCKMLSELY